MELLNTANVHVSILYSLTQYRKMAGIRTIVTIHIRMLSIKIYSFNIVQNPKEIDIIYAFGIWLHHELTQPTMCKMWILSYPSEDCSLYLF